ncbi:hypothetical protein JW968_06010 [Candidatus Woesearchaeota archaeon]|nr:hypothetical protein [Candidatus Woesearchaeota archaeon]
MKTKQRMNKRGVSPLIAAVLLMVLTVVVGALIMNWVNRYVKEQVGGAEERTAGEIACGQDVKWNFMQIDGDTKFCIDNSTENVWNVTFTVENGQYKKLEGFKVRFVDNDGNVCDLPHIEEVDTGGALKISIPLDFDADLPEGCDSLALVSEAHDITELDFLRIYAMVKTSDIDKPVVCTDNYIDVRYWKYC